MFDYPVVVQEGVFLLFWSLRFASGWVYCRFFDGLCDGNSVALIVLFFFHFFFNFLF